MTKILAFQITYMTINNLNPMTILLMIIMFTIIMASMSFLITLNYWTSILIIITYIGGLMIIFLYIISLMNNSKEKWFNLNKTTTTLMMMMTIWMSLNTMMIKSPMKTISMSYSNNMWNLMLIMSMILFMAQMSSKIIFLPFKKMKSTY